MPEAIQHQIAEFIQLNFVFDGSTLDPHASLRDSGLVDSAGMLELLLFLEECFEVSIDDEVVLSGNLDSIAALAAFVLQERERPVAVALRRAG